jgi:signal transduction histidine kinase
MGLRVMHYRAGLIGGQVIVQTRKEGGTEVICRLPLHHVETNEPS